MKTRIFYGWYILAGATVAIFTSTTINSYAPSVLLKPMNAEMGWTRTDFFAILAVAHVVSALAAPFVGRRVDRANPRLLVLVGGLVVGASVMAYSRVSSLWVFLILAGIVTPAGMALCGPAVFNTIVGKWFVRKRGRAMATALSGINVCGMVIPPAMVGLIALFGWRQTWLIVGLAAMVLIVPISLLVRRSPEDMGLRPDGDPQPRPSESTPQQRDEPEWRWRQLLRTPTFWMIAVIFGLNGMAIPGAGMHVYPFLTDGTVSPALAASMVSAISIAGLASRPLWGIILDRWDLRHSALLALVAYGIGTVGLLLTTNVLLLFVVMAIRGFGSGGQNSLAPMFYGHHFGRRSLGQVLGLAQLVGLPFAASGAIVAARLFDVLHSYTVIFLIFGGLLFLCSAAVFLIRPPKACTAPLPAFNIAAGPPRKTGTLP